MATSNENIKELLKHAYAECLRPLIARVATSLCYGCRVDHPSQRQHDVCLMMETRDRVDLCFEDAMDILDRNQAIGTWFGHLSKLSRRPTYHEVWPLLEDKSYEDQDQWREDVKDILVMEITDL